MLLSIIIPSFNEYKNLRILIPQIIKNLEPYLNRKEFEIIIVLKSNNVEGKRKIIESVHRIFRKKNNTYGDAVRSGINYTSGKYICFMDADLSHNPKNFLKIINHINKYDLIIFSRYVKSGINKNNLYLKFSSILVNFVLKKIFQIKYFDITNSFKIYRSDVVKKIKLTTNNFEIIPEILIKYLKEIKNPSTLEVPIIFEKRHLGSSKRKTIISIFGYFKIVYLFFF